MSLTLGGQSTVTGTGSLSPSWPTGTVDGDIGFAAAVGIQWDTLPTLGGMSGWTLLASDTRGMGAPNPRNYFGAIWAKIYAAGDTAPTLTQTGGSGSFPPESRLTLVGFHTDEPLTMTGDVDTVAAAGAGVFTAGAPPAAAGTVFVLVATSSSTVHVGTTWTDPPAGWEDGWAIDRTWFTFRHDTGAGADFDASASNWLVNVSAWRPPVVDDWGIDIIAF